MREEKAVPDSAQLYANYAYAFLDSEEAAQNSLELLKRWSNDEGLMYQVHRTFFWAGKTREAGESAERYFELFPDGYRLVRARQSCAEGRRADAEQLLAEITDYTRWILLKFARSHERN